MATFVSLIKCPMCGQETKSRIIEVRLIEGDDDMGSAVVACGHCNHHHHVVHDFDVVVGRRYSR